MTQKELLKLAEDKAGGKRALSDLTQIRLASFYEWHKGKSIRWDVMMHILKCVGIKFEIKK